ncbi:MAG TPA: hypothetical protein DCP20_03720 [Coriobacteriia bacterium]|jgi:mono/diheme cytochrome c family protein|nr:MAG: DNA uptake protein and related DNA-binding protein-like protein [Actinobacteria bacterium 66_15]HAL29810.1 hypothetical protein [Coriobacteriia bacterium]
MSKRTLITVMLAATLLLLGGCGAEEPAPAPEPTPGEATGLDGEAILNEKCVGCHSLDTVLAEQYDAVGWAAVIDQMIMRGAELTDDEAAALAEYLSLR